MDAAGTFLIITSFRLSPPPLHSLSEDRRGGELGEHVGRLMRLLCEIGGEIYFCIDIFLPLLACFFSLNLFLLIEAEVPLVEERSVNIITGLEIEWKIGETC